MRTQSVQWKRSSDVEGAYHQNSEANLQIQLLVSEAEVPSKVTTLRYSGDLQKYLALALVCLTCEPFAREKTKRSIRTSHQKNQQGHHFVIFEPNQW